MSSEVKTLFLGVLKNSRWASRILLDSHSLRSESVLRCPGIRALMFFISGESTIRISSISFRSEKQPLGLQDITGFPFIKIRKRFKVSGYKGVDVFYQRRVNDKNIFHINLPTGLNLGFPPVPGLFCLFLLIRSLPRPWCPWPCLN